MYQGPPNSIMNMLYRAGTSKEEKKLIPLKLEGFEEVLVDKNFGSNTEANMRAVHGYFKQGRFHFWTGDSPNDEIGDSPQMTFFVWNVPFSLVKKLSGQGKAIPPSLIYEVRSDTTDEQLRALFQQRALQHNTFLINSYFDEGGDPSLLPPVSFMPEDIVRRIASKPLETTVRIGDEFAHIRVTSEALRNNLIAEAVNQGIPKDVAQASAEKTIFMFGGARQVYTKMANQDGNPFKGFVKRLLAFVSINDFYGYVGAEKSDGSNILSLSPDPITKDVNRIYGKQPPEVREAAILQLLDAVWRHERQHLIQNMEPAKRARKAIERKVTKVIMATSLAADIAAFVCVEIPQVPYTIQINMPVIMIGTQIITTGMGLVKHYIYPSEIEARNMQKPENYKPNSPFQITFEK